MKPTGGSGQSKLWVLIFVLLFLILCCCFIVVIGGVFYLRAQKMDLPDLLSQSSQDKTSLPQEVLTPESPDLESENTEYTPVPEALAVTPLDQRLLVVTSNALWLVDENNGETINLDYAPINAPRPYSEGLSPDKRMYAYFTGFGGASNSPFLSIIDLDTQQKVLNLALDGPNSYVDMDAGVGDPAFEAMQAMQYSYSLAWSPDGQKLAFLAAIDGDSSDIYIYDHESQSVSRLTDEASNATSLHWSPDGRFLQYVTINSFGTGAGFSMDAVWVYDFQKDQAQLVENSSNSGETFITWQDNTSFLMNSWDAMCEDFNLRMINAETLNQDVLFDGCFSGVAYDPEDEFGMISITDFNEENCPCGEAQESGIMIFGNSIESYGNRHLLKFQKIIAYNLEFIPNGKLFVVYGDEGLQNIFYNQQMEFDIDTKLRGLKPLPSPDESYWVWASYYSGKTGLWITGEDKTPIKLSDSFSGDPIWRDDSRRLYYFEGKDLMYADATNFKPQTLVKLADVKIEGIIK